MVGVVAVVFGDCGGECDRKAWVGGVGALCCSKGEGVKVGHQQVNDPLRNHHISPLLHSLHHQFVASEIGVSFAK